MLASQSFLSQFQFQALKAKNLFEGRNKEMSKTNLDFQECFLETIKVYAVSYKTEIGKEKQFC